MMKKILPFFIAIGLIAVIIAGYFGVSVINRYIPSKELADVGGLFGHVEGEQVAVVLNHDLSDTKGVYAQGQTYLSIAWVNEKLNDRFYWDKDNKQLIYALPTEIVYAQLDTMGSNGGPLVIEKNNDIYLSLGLILNYTDMRASAYDDGELKRIYITNTWEPEEVAMVKTEGAVREAGGIKSPIVTQLVKNSKVTVLEEMDNWSKVMTEDGYQGYVENKRLKERSSEVPSSTYIAPEYTRIAMDEKVCLVWHQVTSQDANNGMETLMAQTKGVNVISPTWFALTDNSGNFSSLASKTYVDKAHNLGLQVWALVDNFSKDVKSEILLASTANREKLIGGLIKEVKTYGIDGINLDFEGLKSEAGTHYVQFIRELSVACRNNGIVLSVDNYVPAVYNTFYNRKEQGIVADYVIVMGYDEHYAGGETGSVASIDYVENGIKDSLETIPKEKLINAVPFYTRLWTEKDGKTTSSALGISKAKEWLDENKVELYWQESLGQYYGEHEGDAGRQMLWMEEERSLGLKMDLIEKYDLAGVGCWKLGLESAGVWDVIQP